MKAGIMSGMQRDHITDHGGHADGPTLVLVHGLMGRGTTWSRQLPWLRGFGRVYTYDAPWHRGGDVRDAQPVSTERYVDALAEAVQSVGAPVVLIGHSMGGLHSWCLAAQRPDLVSALVVEDMAPDFVGGTTGPWEPWLYSWPEVFTSAGEFTARFGEIAGRYFREAFDRVDGGWRLHGPIEEWISTAAEWGVRDFWDQWRAVQCPALLLEADDTVTPAGQMQKMSEMGRRTTYFKIAGSGHLMHDDSPKLYRSAVSDFLAAPGAPGASVVA
ncbi:alpha/beta family hydrolase [Mycobacteroides abscessus subsp. massiliense CCUG 48898 = JCM 15300]|nr:alpha/beta family hydrolase [Mycobacteroides abscessus subsp. massiliense CCUG 48898 = JCM 15300]